MPRSRLSAAAQGFFDPNGTDRANARANCARFDSAYSYLDMRVAQVDTELAYMDADHQRQRARAARASGAPSVAEGGAERMESGGGGRDGIGVRTDTVLLLDMLLRTLLDMLRDMLLQMLPDILLPTALDMALQMLLYILPQTLLHILPQTVLDMLLATATLGTLPDTLNNKITVPDERTHATLVAHRHLTVQAIRPGCRLGCILPNGEDTSRQSMKKMINEITVSLVVAPVVAPVVESLKREVLRTIGANKASKTSWEVNVTDYPGLFQKLVCRWIARERSVRLKD
ncbi:MAG: hypothetical protein Q9212_001518 [Teloschistes hypoglaucus]